MITRIVPSARLSSLLAVSYSWTPLVLIGLYGSLNSAGADYPHGPAKRVARKSRLKISIITVCYNSATTLEDAIKSVLAQHYLDIEHIVIDGGSTDGTASILKKYSGRIAKVVSEPDDGIYDAMNKGISLATGDAIGVLNSDDFYASNDVIENLVMAFTKETDMVIGDVAFVDRANVQKWLRYVSGSGFSPWLLRFGWMPPHPATFVRKNVYETFGHYKTDFAIAADYEFFVRTLMSGSLRTVHTSKVLVTMRDGGASTGGFKSTIVISREILRALRENRIYSNPLFVWSRLPLKFIRQKLFVPRP
jgi:glycosyltransferase involved in cell wall biosynthesis